ncbi:hypothetical protein Hanom_Chr15g01385891 [Helianthus anomalus]
MAVVRADCSGGNGLKGSRCNSEKILQLIQVFQLGGVLHQLYCRFFEHNFLSYVSVLSYAFSVFSCCVQRLQGRRNICSRRNIISDETRIFRRFVGVAFRHETNVKGAATKQIFNSCRRNRMEVC